MRLRLAPLPLALLGSLVLAAGALAGGWAVVTVTESPADPPAGAGTPIELRVMQHGKTPVSWPRLTVVATDPDSGAAVRAEARAEGPTGRYVATIVFPTGGDWRLTFESADLHMEGAATLPVSPATAAATAAPSTSTSDATPVVLAAALGLLLLVGGALGLRGRRGNRHARPVSAAS